MPSGLGQRTVSTSIRGCQKRETILKRKLNNQVKKDYVFSFSKIFGHLSSRIVIIMGVRSLRIVSLLEVRDTTRGGWWWSWIGGEFERR